MGMTREEALAILDKATVRKKNNIEKALAILDGAKVTRSCSVAHEHQLQVECVKWARDKFPNIIIYAIPNGCYVGPKQAKKLIAEGMTAGVPDLHIPISRHGFHSLYIEMKYGKQGRVREEQKDMLIALKKEGNLVAVCRNREQFEKILTDYFG